MKRTLLPGVLLFAGLFLDLARAQDIHSYYLERREFFTQCITNGPAPDTMRRHYVAAFVMGAYDNALLGGTLSARGATWPLTNNNGQLVLIQQLDAAASPGPYLFAIDTAASGRKVRSINLPPAANRIPPPRVTNLEPAQSIDPAQAFALQWDRLRGLGPRDQFHLRIYDPDGNQLTQTSLGLNQTSYTIEPGILPENRTNTAFLDVVHLLSLTPIRGDKPGTVAVELRSTRFPLTTRNPAGQVRFSTNQIWARETDGAVSIPVERSQGEGTVTVDYFLEGLSAQAGVNFQNVAGTLTFAPGVTAQSITVPLLNDGVVSAPLLARAWLTNVTGGATLPPRRSMDWTVLDESSSPGPNLRAIVLSKVAFFSQTNAALPDQSTECAPARFFTSVHPRFPGAIQRANVRLPKGTLRNLSEPFKTFLEYNEDFPSRAAADKAFPSGAYTVGVDTLTDGLVTVVLRMSREPKFPVPHVVNWDRAQAVDSSSPFAVSWEPFVGATTNDYVLFSIRDSVNGYILVTPEPLEPDALPGTTSSYEIPAGVLQPDKTYFVNLIFAKAARCDTTPAGVRACVLFDHTTSFQIKTLPTPTQ